MVKKINPKARLVDKMFTFPISQYCETTHEDMKKVFVEMGQALHFFSVAENGRASVLPNAKKRKIHLQVEKTLMNQGYSCDRELGETKRIIVTSSASSKLKECNRFRSAAASAC